MKKTTKLIITFSILTILASSYVLYFWIVGEKYVVRLDNQYDLAKTEADYKRYGEIVRPDEKYNPYTIYIRLTPKEVKELKQDPNVVYIERYITASLGKTM